MNTNGEDTLTTLTTGGEDTSKTPFTTHDYPVTTPHDVTDDSCDDIDGIYNIHCPHDWDQVTKMTTRWWQGWLTALTDAVVNLVWRPMWLLLMTCDNWSDDQNTTPMTPATPAILTTLTTVGDYLGLSMWRPVDDPRYFLDNIWRLHLAIFIATVESCLSCWQQSQKHYYHHILKLVVWYHMQKTNNTQSSSTQYSNQIPSRQAHLISNRHVWL